MTTIQSCDAALPIVKCFNIHYLANIKLTIQTKSCIMCITVTSCGRYGVWNHWHCLFRLTSTNTSKLHITEGTVIRKAYLMSETHCKYLMATLQWRPNGRDGVSNHQPHDCLFRRGSKKTSKLRVSALCEGNSPVTGEFPAQMASYAENVSFWWRHHEQTASLLYITSGIYCVYIISEM